VPTLLAEHGRKWKKRIPDTLSTARREPQRFSSVAACTQPCRKDTLQTASGAVSRCPETERVPAALCLPPLPSDIVSLRPNPALLATVCLRGSQMTGSAEYDKRVF